MPESRQEDTERHRYRVFGLGLAGDFQLAGHHLTGASRVDLELDSAPPEELIAELADSRPFFASPCLTQTGESLATLHRFGDREVLRFGAEDDFYLLEGRIICHSHVPEQPWMREIRLLGPVLAFWLERHGVPALHASAIELDGRAVAFLSSSRGGKSTLAAGMVREGYRLLSDDIVAVSLVEGRPWGRPGYPQMRMWPAEADHFVGDHGKLSRIHPDFEKGRVPVTPSIFGDFCDTPLPLAAILMPERREADADIEWVPIPGRQAVIELVRHSFSPHIVAAVGLQPSRLEVFGQVAESIPIQTLRYPAGLEHLQATCRAIAQRLS